MSNEEKNETNNKKEIINIHLNNNSQNNLNVFTSNNGEINPMINQLIEFGYDYDYSRRVFNYFHPNNIDEALNYMVEENGIIQHRFIKNRRDISNKLCYICGFQEELHLKEFNININKNEINEEEKVNKNNYNNKKNYNGTVETKNILNDFHEGQYLDKNNGKDKNKSETSIDEISYNNNFKNNENKYHINQIKNIKDDGNIITNDLNINFQEKIECKICNEKFIANDKNKVKICGHAFCNKCWYDFLSIKIKENKLSSIKCLDYNCKEKISDKFIVNLLNFDIILIKKYKRYKLELLILNDPNKKLCPYPDCDSYLELKNKKGNDVTCLNNHTYCFICLKKPHGKSPCNADIESSIIEYTKNNFVKKCPNCSILTEKIEGCNHIICTKCGYQWCWLCNKKYFEGHFREGKCKGFQFFKPKNDYEIKLAMEGKIRINELPNSRREFAVGLNQDLNLPIEDNYERNIIMERERRERRGSRDNIVRAICDIITSLFFPFIILFYILFGHFFFIELNTNNENFAILIYFILSIPFCFHFIYMNFIIIVIRLISLERLTNLCVKDEHVYYIKVILSISINFILGVYCHCFYLWKKIINKKFNKIKSRKIMKILAIFPCIFVSIIIFYPYQIIINFISLIIICIKEHNFGNFMAKLDKNYKSGFTLEVIEE